MMKVLLITNKDDVTIDFVVKELKERNVPFYRFNTEDLLSSIDIHFNFALQEFTLIDKNKIEIININEVGSVYYRRPEIPSLQHIDDVSDDERIYLQNEIIFLLEGIYKLLSKIYWLNNVYQIREAENKIYQLQLAREIGFRIPNSIISNQYDNIIEFFSSNNADCIKKPIKTGNLHCKDTSKVVFTSQVERKHLEEPERIEAFPLYMQENIQKQCDLRVTVIGDKVYTAEIHSQDNAESTIDWRRGSLVLEHRMHELPESIQNMCIALTHKLGLNFSAIDLILDKKGEYIFLEINPNGQWAWIEHRLGFPLSKEIVSLLEGALASSD